MTDADLKTAIEQLICGQPVYQYAFRDPRELLFTERVREICRQECPRYGRSWSCPPAVGSVASCREKCLSWPHVLFLSTVAEVSDISSMEETLATRAAHEAVTISIENGMRAMGLDVYTLSSDSCAICESGPDAPGCAYPGSPCRHPEVMHPCIESHGIVVADLVEKCEMDYYLGERVLLWFSLLFYREKGVSV